jgi:hypothetical protein
MSESGYTVKGNHRLGKSDICILWHTMEHRNLETEVTKIKGTLATEAYVGYWNLGRGRLEKLETINTRDKDNCAIIGTGN